MDITDDSEAKTTKEKATGRMKRTASLMIYYRCLMDVLDMLLELIVPKEKLEATVQDLLDERKPFDISPSKNTRFLTKVEGNGNKPIPLRRRASEPANLMASTQPSSPIANLAPLILPGNPNSNRHSSGATTPRPNPEKLALLASLEFWIIKTSVFMAITTVIGGLGSLGLLGFNASIGIFILAGAGTLAIVLIALLVKFYLVNKQVQLAQPSPRKSVQAQPEVQVEVQQPLAQPIEETLLEASEQKQKKETSRIEAFGKKLRSEVRRDSAPGILENKKNPEQKTPNIYSTMKKEAVPKRRLRTFSESRRSNSIRSEPSTPFAPSTPPTAALTEEDEERFKQELSFYLDESRKLQAKLRRIQKQKRMDPGRTDSPRNRASKKFKLPLTVNTGI